MQEHDTCAMPYRASSFSDVEKLLKCDPQAEQKLFRFAGNSAGPILDETRERRWSFPVHACNGENWNFSDKKKIGAEKSPLKKGSNHCFPSLFLTRSLFTSLCTLLCVFPPGGSAWNSQSTTVETESWSVRDQPHPIRSSLASIMVPWWLLAFCGSSSISSVRASIFL